MSAFTYCGGRFTVPPGFDFRLLPLKTKRVAVISIIGSWNFFVRKLTSEFVETFLEKSVFTLPCGESLIQGYYDCERQLIFLHFRDSEKLLSDLLEKSTPVETIYEEWDAEKLKNLYYLFLVSHFILIVTYGTSLDTRMIGLFKLIEKLRVKLHHSVETLLRTLPLPRYCIQTGRVSTPRLLFVFKLPPSIAARKLTENENALLALENNLVGQIFNIFHESGLLDGNSSENRLFDLMGYSYVRVLYPDCVERFQQFTEDSDKDDLAQQLLESIINTTVPSMMDDCYPQMGTATPAPTPLYPPPDRSDDRSFTAFLQSHLTNLLDDPSFRQNQNDPSHSHFSFELPTCKAWFIACYKLYTSLMDDRETSLRNARVLPAGELDTPAGPTLAKSWKDLFTDHACLGSTLEGLNRTPTAAGLGLATPAMLDRRWSEMRSEAALSAAETHYRQDLPTHYSRTYHLAKVISAYNVVLRLARGPSVIPTLDKLTRRLARLYLAGRVGCPAISTTGSACKQELHKLPERFEGVAIAIAALRKTTTDKTSAAVLAGKITTASEMDAVVAAARKASSIFSNEKIPLLSIDMPPTLTGQWRTHWLQAVVKLVEQPQPSVAVNFVADKESAKKTTPNIASTTTHLAVIPHRSDVKFVSSCNCGRQQAQRLDPFDYREANWEFYNFVGLNCCSKLASVLLAPDYLNMCGHHFCVGDYLEKESPKPADVAAAEDKQGNLVSALSTDQKESDVDGEAMLNLVDDDQAEDADDLVEAFFNANEDFVSENEASSSAHSQSSSAFSVESSLDLEHGLDKEERYKESRTQHSEDSEAPRTSRRELQRVGEDKEEEEEAKTRNGQMTTFLRKPVPKTPVTFLDCMPTLNQAAGLLPLYSSFAIYALGKYFSYSHSSGFAYPGFLRGSNFLLPWDVQLSRAQQPNASIQNWHSNSRSGRGKGRQRDLDAIKLFIGFEMECSLGHRFFLAGPERAMVGLMQGCDVRRAVTSLLSRDLPIYLPCRCSTGAADRRRFGGQSEEKGDEGEDIVWAQMMRIYIALPSAPVRVRFQPQIRPGPPDTPIFHLGSTLDQQMDAEAYFEGVVPQLQRSGSIDSQSDISETGQSSKTPGMHQKVSSNNTTEAGYVYLDNGFLWVARLPFSYQDGETVYRRPKNSQLANQCRLLGGSITLEEL